MGKNLPLLDRIHVERLSVEVRDPVRNRCQNRIGERFRDAICPVPDGQIGHEGLRDILAGRVVTRVGGDEARIGRLSRTPANLRGMLRIE